MEWRNLLHESNLQQPPWRESYSGLAGIVEVKAISGLAGEHRAQILNYIPGLINTS